MAMSLPYCQIRMRLWTVIGTATHSSWKISSFYYDYQVKPLV